MSGRVSRRTLLAGLAAVPAPALVGCDDDWSGAGPSSTPAPSTSPTDSEYQHRPSPQWMTRVSGYSGWAPPPDRPNSRRLIDADLGPHRRPIRRWLSRRYSAGSSWRASAVIVENRLSDIDTVHWHGMHHQQYTLLILMRCCPWNP